MEEETNYSILFVYAYSFPLSPNAGSISTLIIKKLNKNLTCKLLIPVILRCSDFSKWRYNLGIKELTGFRDCAMQASLNRGESIKL